MNKLILASFIFFGITANAYAEKGDVLQGDIQQVVELPNMDKQAIYTNSRQWIATKFNSAQSVIQMDDKENGIIISKGNIKYPCQNSWLCTAYADDVVKFTLKIEAKDNKARLTFSDITRYSPPNPQSPAVEMPVTNTTKKLDTVGQVRAQFTDVINNYKASVNNTALQKDNW